MIMLLYHFATTKDFSYVNFNPSWEEKEQRFLTASDILETGPQRNNFPKITNVGMS